ncbi:DNA polymerase subunit Cdc27 [Podospora appendiculata]|uniref:DNA polymerase delta subunit 3 n=1 Tax=Podospora appendiculata TaxID=314037 RepID=A0AAE0X9B4_9PEZI|nr:DNA polymerase subunit Cdc27 [Podospora appendiculata]
MDVYPKFLAENVLAEDKVVTYRLLSRALHVHVNTAKQMLYDFHKTQNEKRAGVVHATYLVYGVKPAVDLASASHNGGDGDVEMTSSMPDVDSVDDDVVPTFTLSIVAEEGLEDALAEYDEVTSIHLYSVGPLPTKDFTLLAGVANEVLSLGAEDANKNPGPISNPRMHRRERQVASAKAKTTAAAAHVKPKHEPKQEPSRLFPVKPAPAPAPAKITGEVQAVKPDSEKPEKGSSSAPSKKPAPALKRGGSANSSIMHAFSKATTKVQKAETSQPATPSGDDSSLQPMSDDGEDDTEIPQPRTRAVSDRKNKTEREEELRRMMEEDDDDDEDEEEKAESIAEEPEEPEEEVSTTEPTQDEPTEVATTSGDGRRRGKRRITKKKQIMDDQGYLVTIQEPGWESFSEDEAPVQPVAVKPKTVNSAPPALAAKPKKSGPKGSQGSIMSFFSKK